MKKITNQWLGVIVTGAMILHLMVTPALAQSTLSASDRAQIVIELQSRVTALQQQLTQLLRARVVTLQTQIKVLLQQRVNLLYAQVFQLESQTAARWWTLENLKIDVQNASAKVEALFR